MRAPFASSLIPPLLPAWVPCVYATFPTPSLPSLPFPIAISHSLPPTLSSRPLQGVCITFSRCWPQDRNPRHEPLWQLAEALGATCLTAFDPRLTTHVVAAAGGTEKVRHCGLVSPEAPRRAPLSAPRSYSCISPLQAPAAGTRPIAHSIPPPAPLTSESSQPAPDVLRHVPTDSAH